MDRKTEQDCHVTDSHDTPTGRKNVRPLRVADWGACCCRSCGALLVSCQLPETPVTELQQHRQSECFITTSYFSTIDHQSHWSTKKSLHEWNMYRWSEYWRRKKSRISHLFIHAIAHKLKEARNFASISSRKWRGSLAARELAARGSFSVGR